MQTLSLNTKLIKRVTINTFLHVSLLEKVSTIVCSQTSMAHLAPIDRPPTMSPTTPAIRNHAEEKDPAPIMADSLDDLPAEIPLFDCYHNTMIESVLSGPYSITPPKVRKAIRAMAFVRSGQLPFVDLEELRIFMQNLLPTHRLPNDPHQWIMYNLNSGPFGPTLDKTKQET